MHTILEKKQLSEQVFMMKIDAPLIAEARSPGQFIILQVDVDYGERIPLTIADADAVEGSITTSPTNGSSKSIEPRSKYAPKCGLTEVCSGHVRNSRPTHTHAPGSGLVVHSSLTKSGTSGSAPHDLR